jgi:hypothetical protein
MNTMAILAIIAIVIVVGVIESIVIIRNTHAALAAESIQGLCASITAHGGTFGGGVNGTILASQPSQCHTVMK